MKDVGQSQFTRNKLTGQKAPMQPSEKRAAKAAEAGKNAIPRRKMQKSNPDNQFSESTPSHTIPEIAHSKRAVIDFLEEEITDQALDNDRDDAPPFREFSVASYKEQLVKDYIRSRVKLSRIKHVLFLRRRRNRRRSMSDAEHFQKEERSVQIIVDKIYETQGNKIAKSLFSRDQVNKINDENLLDLLYDGIVTKENSDNVESSKLENLISKIERSDNIKMAEEYLKAVIAIEANEQRGEITAPPNGKYFQGVDVDGNIVDWLNQEYADVMDGVTFGRNELSVCDPKALTALKSHETKFGKVSLDDLNLPTITGKNINLLKGMTPKHVKAAQSAQKSRKLYENTIAYKSGKPSP